MVSKKKSYAPIIATPWKPPQAQKEFNRRIATAERKHKLYVVRSMGAGRGFGVIEVLRNVVVAT